MDVEQMIINNTKLVYQVINDLEFIPESVDRDDLEQIGRISLWKAIEGYDKDSKYALSTCCYRKIYTDIVGYLRKQCAKKRSGVINVKTYETSFENELIDTMFDTMLVQELRKHLKVIDFNIFYDKVVLRLTYDELVKKYGLSKKQLRNRIEESKSILKTNVKWEEMV